MFEIQNLMDPCFGMEKSGSTLFRKAPALITHLLRRKPQAMPVRQINAPDINVATGAGKEWANTTLRDMLNNPTVPKRSLRDLSKRYSEQSRTPLQ